MMSEHDSRALQDGQCIRQQAFTTDYNGNQQVPPYQGIMFEVVATSDITVTTLELDVRIDRMTDMMIEAFVAESGYQEIINDPLRWNRVASGNLQLLGGTTAGIPEKNFQSFDMKKGERRSIYVSLLSGSYLDHTVFALEKTGELAAENKDIKLYVGTGFHGPSFTSPPDKVLNPQFAGSIRYETTVACSSLIRETSVPLSFVAEIPETSGEFSRLPFLLAEAMGKVVDDLLTNDSQLSELVDTFQLRRTNEVKTKESDFSNGVCPDEWVDCPLFYHEIDVQLVHSEALVSGKVLQLVYGAIAEFQAQAIKVVDQLQQGRRAFYVGQILTDVPFNIQLEGPGVSVPMTVPQANYFAEQVFAFIVATKGQAPILILDVVIEGQRAHQSRRILKSTIDRTEILGRVVGTAPVGFAPDFFGAAIADSFELYPASFLELVKTEGAKPSIIDSKSFSLFEKLEDARVTIQVPVVAYIPPSKVESTKSLVFFIVIGIVGGLTVLFGSFKFSKFTIRRVKDEKERRIYREKMRQERREKRIERNESREELVSVDGTTDLSLWGEIDVGSENGSTSQASTPDTKSTRDRTPSPRENESPGSPTNVSSSGVPMNLQRAMTLDSFLDGADARSIPLSSQSLADHRFVALDKEETKTVGPCVKVHKSPTAGSRLAGFEHSFNGIKIASDGQTMTKSCSMPGEESTRSCRTLSTRGIGRSLSSDGLGASRVKFPAGRRIGNSDQSIRDNSPSRSVASQPPQRLTPSRHQSQSSTIDLHPPTAFEKQPRVVCAEPRLTPGATRGVARSISSDGLGSFQKQDILRTADSDRTNQGSPSDKANKPPPRRHHSSVALLTPIRSNVENQQTLDDDSSTICSSHAMPHTQARPLRNTPRRHHSSATVLQTSQKRNLCLINDDSGSVASHKPPPQPMRHPPKRHNSSASSLQTQPTTTKDHPLQARSTGQNIANRQPPRRHQSSAALLQASLRSNIEHQRTIDDDSNTVSSSKTMPHTQAHPLRNTPRRHNSSATVLQTTQKRRICSTNDSPGSAAAHKPAPQPKRHPLKRHNSSAAALQTRPMGKCIAGRPVGDDSRTVASSKTATHSLPNQPRRHNSSTFDIQTLQRIETKGSSGPASPSEQFVVMREVGRSKSSDGMIYSAKSPSRSSGHWRAQASSQPPKLPSRGETLTNSSLNLVGGAAIHRSDSAPKRPTRKSYTPEERNEETTRTIESTEPNSTHGSDERAGMSPMAVHSTESPVGTNLLSGIKQHTEETSNRHTSLDTGSPTGKRAFSTNLLGTEISDDGNRERDYIDVDSTQGSRKKAQDVDTRSYNRKGVRRTGSSHVRGTLENGSSDIHESKRQVKDGINDIVENAPHRNRRGGFNQNMLAGPGRADSSSMHGSPLATSSPELQASSRPVPSRRGGLSRSMSSSIL